MEIKEVTRSVSRKINLGNYETKDYFCSVKYEVGNEDEAVEASRKAIEICEQEIMQDANMLKNKLRAKAEEEKNKSPF